MEQKATTFSPLVGMIGETTAGHGHGRPGEIDAFDAFVDDNRELIALFVGDLKRNVIDHYERGDSTGAFVNLRGILEPDGMHRQLLEAMPQVRQMFMRPLELHLPVVWVAVYALYELLRAKV